jgi:Ras-related protein Rab-5C
MADEDKGALPCKVVLTGESGVGKTSIISRYISNTFSSFLTATPGASFTTKTVFLEEFNQSIKFEIWDTAGQEKYRALAKVFYKNAAVCIMVYDITRRASFEELKNYWINEIKSNSSPNLCKLYIYFKTFILFYLNYSACCGWK